MTDRLAEVEDEVKQLRAMLQAEAKHRTNAIAEAATTNAELRAEIERLRGMPGVGVGETQLARIQELRAEVERLRQHDHEATNMTIDQGQEIGRLRVALTGFVRWVEDLGDTMSPQTRALYDKAREALAQAASPTDACT